MSSWWELELTKPEAWPGESNGLLILPKVHKTNGPGTVRMEWLDGVQKDSLLWKLYFRVHSCSSHLVSVEGILWALQGTSLILPAETEVHVHLHRKCAMYSVLFAIRSELYPQWVSQPRDKTGISELWVAKNIETDVWHHKWVSREHGGWGRRVLLSTLRVWWLSPRGFWKLI